MRHRSPVDFRTQDHMRQQIAPRRQGRNRIPRQEMIDFGFLRGFPGCVGRIRHGSTAFPVSVGLASLASGSRPVNRTRAEWTRGKILGVPPATADRRLLEPRQKPSGRPYRAVKESGGGLPSPAVSSLPPKTRIFTYLPDEPAAYKVSIRSSRLVPAGIQEKPDPADRPVTFSSVP